MRIKGAQRAETSDAAGSGKHTRNQLSHPEAVDLSRKNQDCKDTGRTSPRAGERDRPYDSHKIAARRYCVAAAEFPENQRAESVDRAGDGGQVQRAPRSSEISHWRTADHLNHHGGRRERDAAEAGRSRGSADQVNRSHDFAGMSVRQEMMRFGSTL